MRARKTRRGPTAKWSKTSKGEHRACRAHPSKIRYKDHDSAVTAKHTLERLQSRDISPLRIYECNSCSGYHLTSQRTWGENHE